MTTVLVTAVGGGNEILVSAFSKLGISELSNSVKSSLLQTFG